MELSGSLFLSSLCYRSVRAFNSMIVKECQFCGKGFKVSDCYKKAKFCSQSCSAKWQNKHNRKMGFKKGHKSYKTSEHSWKKCEFCHKRFLITPSISHRRFCSYNCTYSARKTGSWKKCLFCGKKFWARRKSKRKFCSRHCYFSFRKKQPKITLSCQICGKKFKVIPSKIKYGRKYCSWECWVKSKIGIRRKESTNEKIKEAHKRKEFGFQKGLIPKNKFKDRYLICLRARIRTKDQYLEWRLKIINRDKRKCDVCNSTSSKENPILAHHLESFSSILINHNIRTIDEAFNCKELFDINNGITLCKKCHLAFHRIYGNGNNTEEQYNEFKNSFPLISSPTIRHEQILSNQVSSDKYIS